MTLFADLFCMFDLFYLRSPTEAAELLGYSSHADFILDNRMAKSSANVINFQNEIAEKLQPLKEKEMKIWLELKKKEKESLNEAFDNQIHSYDWSYYHRVNKEINYQVNEAEIKNYFPLEVVLEGVLRIYEEILSLSFKEIKPEVWHESVRIYQVYDATGEYLGECYLDLFPRLGKFGHGAVFPLRMRHEFPDGRILYPAIAMLANFTKPTENTPSLMQWNEVVTFFHEFGHLTHEVCTKSPYYLFSGIKVETDFLEAPSQMLENWCYKPEALNRLSGHFLDHSKKLPPEHFEKIVKAKNADVGLLTSRQIALGMFDQKLHSFSGDTVDVAATFAWAFEHYTGVSPPDNTNYGSGFGHMMGGPGGGYDSQYYSYLYSKVFSCDMFSLFETESIFSKRLGKLYRDLILSPGGTKDSLHSLREFLGREPSSAAFLASLGLDH